MLFHKGTSNDDPPPHFLWEHRVWGIGTRNIPSSLCGGKVVEEEEAAPLTASPSVLFPPFRSVSPKFSLGNSGLAGIPQPKYAT